MTIIAYIRCEDEITWGHQNILLLYWTDNTTTIQLFRQFQFQRTRLNTIKIGLQTPGTGYMRFGKNFLDGVDEWIGRMDGRNKEWTMAVTMIVTITMKLKSGHRWRWYDIQRVTWESLRNLWTAFAGAQWFLGYPALLVEHQIPLKWEETQTYQRSWGMTTPSIFLIILHMLGSAWFCVWQS